MVREEEEESECAVKKGIKAIWLAKWEKKKTFLFLKKQTSSSGERKLERERE